MNANTASAISTAAIALAVAVGMASCSWAAADRDRAHYAYKTTCFEQNGTWDSWTSTCVRTQQPEASK